MASKRKRKSQGGGGKRHKSTDRKMMAMTKRAVYRLLETKKVGGTMTSGTTFATGNEKSWNIMNTLTLGTTGTGPNQRLGDAITIQNIRISGVFDNPDASTTRQGGPILMRVILLKTEEFQTVSNITSPYRSDIGAVNWTSQSATLGPLDTDRVVVLSDRLVKIEPNQYVSANGGQGAGFIHDIKVNQKVTFKSGSTAQLKGHNYYLFISGIPLAWSAGTNQTSGPNFRGQCYMTFKDS